MIEARLAGFVVLYQMVTFGQPETFQIASVILGRFDGNDGDGFLAQLAGFPILLEIEHGAIARTTGSFIFLQLMPSNSSNPSLLPKYIIPRLSCAIAQFCWLALYSRGG